VISLRRLRRLRRGVTAAAVIVLPLPVLAACGAGADAETDLVRPDNASTQVEDIKIQNVNVILLEEGEEGESLAGISARLFNTGSEDQTLEEIKLPGTGDTVELAPAEGESGSGSGIVVPAGGDVALGGEGNASAIITDPSPDAIQLGNAQRVIFDLSETGGIPLRARVVNDSGQFEQYDEWGPTPTPTETETEETPAADETE
jgi:hypothetical protein